MNKTSFVSTWIEQYCEIHKNTAFLSKLAAFLVALIAILDFVDLSRRLLTAVTLYFQAEIERENFDTILFKTALGLIFQFLIVLIFSSRFVSFWYKSRKYFWLTQALWLGGIFAVFAYMAVPRYILSGSIQSGTDMQCMDCIYFNTFISASPAFVVIILLYFQFSILKQILFLSITSIMAVGQTFKKIGN